MYLFAWAVITNTSKTLKMFSGSFLVFQLVSDAAGVNMQRMHPWKR